MNIIKNTALTFFMAVFLGASSTLVFAEASADNSAASINETIAHVEQALVDVNKSDFAAANLHMKAALLSSGQIEGNETIVKQAVANVVQAQIQSKEGEVEKSSGLLTKGLELYKSL